MRNRNSKFKTLMWLGGIVAFAALSIAVAASWLLYQRTITLLTDNLRERLLSISITEAANISVTALDLLQVEADWKKPEWREVVSSLKKAKDANPNIVFMYIFRHHRDDPAKMEFVADAESINPYANTDSDPNNNVDANGDGKIEPDGADKLQWPGQDYPEAADIPEAFQAYGGPLTVHDLYQDSYGRVLTGYAPIKDENGNVVAILGTDIKADDFFTVTQQTLYPFLIFIVGLIFIIALLSMTLIFIWRRRAEMLTKLSEELEIANGQQESLLHFISHEVKGFLTEGQNAFAGIVEGDYGEAPPQLLALARGALLKMRTGVDTVMNILDASNLKKGTVSYKKEPYDFAVVVEDAVRILQPKADEKHLAFKFVIDKGHTYEAVGDKEKIEQHVIRNLIDNAIRYTLTGSITISLSDGDGKIRFAVKDTGVGISTEDRSKLFTEGGHGKDSIKVNVDSTGYGLFIAKQVTEAHGGRITAESAGAGKGSEFVVELPVQ